MGLFGPLNQDNPLVSQLNDDIHCGQGISVFGYQLAAVRTDKALHRIVLLLSVVAHSVRRIAFW
jgi:hypothetical protein